MSQCTVIDYLAKRTFASTVRGYLDKSQCTVTDYLAKRTLASSEGLPG